MKKSVPAIVIVINRAYHNEVLFDLHWDKSCKLVKLYYDSWGFGPLTTVGLKQFEFGL